MTQILPIQEIEPVERIEEVPSTVSTLGLVLNGLEKLGQLLFEEPEIPGNVNFTLPRYQKGKYPAGAVSKPVHTGPRGYEVKFSPENQRPEERKPHIDYRILNLRGLGKYPVHGPNYKSSYTGNVFKVNGRYLKELDKLHNPNDPLPYGQELWGLTIGNQIYINEGLNPGQQEYAMGHEGFHAKVNRLEGEGKIRKPNLQHEERLANLAAEGQEGLALQMLFKAYGNERNLNLEGGYNSNFIINHKLNDGGRLN